MVFIKVYLSPTYSLRNNRVLKHVFQCYIILYKHDTDIINMSNNKLFFCLQTEILGYNYMLVYVMICYDML